MESHRLRLDVGALQARHARTAKTIEEAEFSCFSQFGEDGIIQWLIARVPIANEAFVEFGVQDYTESNTRFLLLHDNWRGLILDGGTSHVSYAHKSGLSELRWLDAKTAWITRENINDLLSDLAGDIGLLSIDIDGNDYWVFEALTVVQPRIVIIEYNSHLGHDRPVVVPYDPEFCLTEAHWSFMYWGASLPALIHLAHRKGYRFVGSDKVGLNAFFVRDDIAGNLPNLTAPEGWRESRFRNSRDGSGRQTYLGSHVERLALIEDMPLIDVSTGQNILVGDLLKPATELAQTKP
jgi:hypothetical protein